MSRGPSIVLLLLLAGLLDAVRVTPVQKVVQLLKKLRVQVQDEGAAEAAGYDKFSCFCKEQSNNKVYSIKKSDGQIEKLEASLEELGGAIAALDQDVASTKENVEKEEGEAKAAEDVEGERLTAHEKKRDDLNEGVDGITRAIASLHASKGDVQASLVAQKSARKLVALLSQKPAAYKYQSDEVIATLQQLLVTFKAQLAECQEEGATARHAFNMAEGARANKVKAFKKEIAEKEALSAAKGEQKAEEEGLLTEEQTARGKDQAFLDELTSTCEDKASAWDARSKARAGELTAMTEAIGILDGMGGLYSVNKKLVDLQRPSFLQFQASRHNARIRSLVKFLDREAHGLNSGVLATLATQLRFGGDHFTKVRGIINDLIARLESEAAAEADQKSFCDGEMASAVEKRDKQSAKIESHSAEIETRTSQIKTLTGEISGLETEIAALYKALNEMQELRTKEKAQNEKSIVEAQDGVQALAAAIEALKSFYGEEGASMVQVGRYEPEGGDRHGQTVSDMAPETFSNDDYSGKTEESKGIFGLLQIIKSDFERTESTTTTAEEEAQSKYEEQKATTEADIDAKKSTKESKVQEKETKTTERTGFQDDLQDAKQLHAESLEQLEKLKASCVDTGESWEERKKHREQEIEALKQAMQILEDWKGF